MSGRDPLSIYYDATAHQLVLRAARASRSNRGVQAWVASPRGEFRALDRGGRTRHERAFTRSVYYLVWREPVNAGRPMDWSLKLTWGDDADRRPSARGRLARPVIVRMWPKDQARVTGPRWVGTDLQAAGRRIDE